MRRLGGGVVYLFAFGLLSRAGLPVAGYCSNPSLGSWDFNWVKRHSQSRIWLLASSGTAQRWGTESDLGAKHGTETFRIRDKACSRKLTGNRLQTRKDKAQSAQSFSATSYFVTLDKSVTSWLITVKIPNQMLLRVPPMRQETPQGQQRCLTLSLILPLHT